MKRVGVIFCFLALVMSGCGKDDDKTAQVKDVSVVLSEQSVGSNDKAELPLTRSAFINVLNGNPEKFLQAFNQYDKAHQYYFCAAFAMGAMSVVKPITASAMVNYFMGLGVAKYQVGINDSTYEAFNAGKNVFLHESLVNTILEKKICEKSMNEATEYARDNKLDVAYLDRRGKYEVEKVLEYIAKEKH